ncbi:MAG: ABC transporter ATP-binding protein [Deltaproteobacteria bacterium]|nr:ABC transporter ATP-binding protein [Candidatus Tharpella aukensis]
MMINSCDQLDSSCPPAAESFSKAREAWNPLLEVSELSCGYGDQVILDKLNFKLWPGFFCGILGPNGCGKSTLINTICRVNEPLSGSLMLGEQDLCAIPRQELAAQIAVVPQETHVAFPFKVREVVAMGRNPHLSGFFGSGYDLENEQVDRALSATGISHLAERAITRLSGGERQLVLLARALAQEPKLLLLDEPTSNLDINHSVKILRLVANKVRQEKLTAFAVFHDLNLAGVFADYLFLVKDGTIRYQGETREVITEEILTDLYEMPLTVYEPPGLGRPQVAVRA